MTNKNNELKETWKEIIETANNQDPKYSFELFKEILDNKEKEINELKRRLKVLEVYDTSKIKKAKKEMLDKFEDMVEELIKKYELVDRGFEEENIVVKDLEELKQKLKELKK